MGCGVDVEKPPQPRRCILCTAASTRRPLFLLYVSTVALAEVGQFREAVQYVQKAAKVLYEGAREVFEKVKVAARRLVELFVEAVTRVLAWADEHKAYHFLMAAVAAGVVALAAALNLWGLVELEKLAHAASLTPFFAGRTKTGGRRLRGLGHWPRGTRSGGWMKTLLTRSSTPL